MTKVVMHYKRGCSWCDKFKDEQEQWVPPYWNFERVEGGASTYPTFIVSVDTGSRTLVGYQSVEDVQQVIQEMKNGL